MKKILGTVLLVSALILAAGVATAATQKNNGAGIAQYSPEVKTCIKNAMQSDAMKAAKDAFKAATKDALQTKQDAIDAAQKLTDKTAKTDAIKAANQEYNDNKTVKQAKVALSNARTNVTETCKQTAKNNSSSGTASVSGNKSIWQSILDFLHL